MSRPRPKGPATKIKGDGPVRITSLKMSSGRVVTDPDEINRLLKQDGFEVDEQGKVTLGPRLQPQ